MTVAMSGEEASFIFWGTSLDRDTGLPISNALVTKTNRMTGEQSQIQSNIVFMEAARKAKELKEAKEEAKAKAAATPETAAPTHCHGT